jgi:poly-gamma-glutamate synthesis protein (capsule biosynthesis protein)
MVTLTFFGDFVCQAPLNVSFTERFSDWAKADIEVCNFEAPVKTDASPAPKSGPSLCQSEESPQFLERMGFNVILLANNHIMDYGEKGLQKTISSFKDSYVIGAGRTSLVYEPLIIERGGVKVGLISLVQHEFGIVDDLKKDAKGTAWINHPIVPTMVKNAKEQCDVLIVLPHAGFENIDAPLPEWRDAYKALIDQGADIVIASHPHVPQGWEEYKGKRIYYSLGNFCFDKKIGNNSYWTKSLSVKVTITEERRLEFSHQNIIFNEGMIDVDDSEETQRHNEYLQELLQDSSKYEEYIDAELSKFWESYKLYLLRGLGGFSFKGSFNTLLHSAYGVLKGEDVPMLINNFQCETHSWAIQRILRNKMK